jgi:hypothetical protein
MPQPQTPAPPAGFVGIFWFVPDGGELRLVVDRTPLVEAEPYGEALTHPRGHYEVWEKWQRLGPAGLARAGLPPVIAWSEYEHHPRGRAVYHRPTSRFTLYADRKLQTPEFIARIADALAIPADAYDVRSDAHYRTR